MAACSIASMRCCRCSRSRWRSSPFEIEAMNRQRLCILGSTGSVGTSTLDVVARHPDRFEVVGLTAHQRIDELAAQCLRWKPRYAVVSGAEQARTLRGALREGGVRTEV